MAVVMKQVWHGMDPVGVMTPEVDQVATAWTEAFETLQQHKIGDIAGCPDPSPEGEDEINAHLQAIWAAFAALINAVLQNAGRNGYEADGALETACSEYDIGVRCRRN